jgi:hypothetical protein
MDRGFETLTPEQQAEWELLKKATGLDKLEEEYKKRKMQK